MSDRPSMKTEAIPTRTALAKKICAAGSLELTSSSRASERIGKGADAKASVTSISVCVAVT
jgi:hypothetical protein